MQTEAVPGRVPVVPLDPDDLAASVLAGQHADLVHAVRRMLQALDAYWIHRDDVEILEFGKARARVEEILNA
jgi:hypothetical protein